MEATTRNSLAWSRSSSSPSARRWAMNSSVTFDSAISVTSSLCLPISCSSRSNGPSKLVSWTVKRAARRRRPQGPPVPRRCCCSRTPSLGVAAAQLPLSRRTSTESSPRSARSASSTDDRLADDPAAVGGHPVLAAQGQPGGLQRDELVGGDVDGDLLVVLGAVGPAARRTAPGGDRAAACVGAGAGGAVRRRGRRRRRGAAGHQGQRRAGSAGSSERRRRARRAAPASWSSCSGWAAR